jgi:hypothetical protein
MQRDQSEKKLRSPTKETSLIGEAGKMASSFYVTPRKTSKKPSENKTQYD